MATSLWANAVAKVSKYAILIETPGGRGTGYVVQSPPGSGNSCVITAWHVVQHAHEWHEPIKLTHFPSNKQAFLNANSRRITSAQQRDQAIIEFSAKDLPLPTERLPLMEINKRLNAGVEIGWLGFPGVAPFSLCFFCGHISAWLEQDEAYLVDGVAINGVSGGPAFVQDEKENPTFIGLVTEYRPNFATGAPLPGVSLVRSINPLVQHYATLKEQLTKKQMEAAKVQEIPKDQATGGSPTS
jgi:hypothetical protein